MHVHVHARSYGLFFDFMFRLQKHSQGPASEALWLCNDAGFKDLMVDKSLQEKFDWIHLMLIIIMKAFTVDQTLKNYKESMVLDLTEKMPGFLLEVKIV
jgi:hypothetical protein